MTSLTGAAPVSPALVDAFILWHRRDLETTPMHALKLVYLSHGWMLGIHDQPLINEPIEAWTYGPVVPSIYHRYKSFGGDPITVVPVDRSDQLADDQLALIREVVWAYRDYTAGQLSNITHQPGTPWDIVRRESGVGAIIPNELIQGHYRRLAQREDAA